MSRSPGAMLNQLLREIREFQKIRPHSNPYLAKLIYLNFHPLQVVSRYRDPQLQMDEYYPYFFNLFKYKDVPALKELKYVY